MDYLDSFGDWLRQRREALRLTRPELAECAGCSVSALRKIEADERRPSRQLAELLADCLHISPEEQSSFIDAARGVHLVARLGSPMPPATRLPPIPLPFSPRVDAGAPAAGPDWNLPAPMTKLVGREAELATLEQLLTDPGCRLLTLVGLGGIGKSRLGIEAACNVWPRFADGVYFAPLAAINSPEFMVPAIAEAVGLNFAGPTEPDRQLVNYLNSKQALLLLDNLEHLLDGVGLLVEMLKKAPGLKLLATSRERLELQAEWVFDVQGLPVPAEDEMEGLEKYSSVQLFLQRARQVQTALELAAEDGAHVARICRLVEGMPLAIELAAAWVPVLSPREIADEIEHGLDILTMQHRDVPERQRSLKAVFDHSWKLLAEEEQRLLRQLSVFRGGFQREAAREVAGASLPLLSTLLAKSFLRRTATGRYDSHELIRQYGASKLAEDPQELHTTEERHSRYYLDLLGQRDGKLKSHLQREAVAELTGEIDNIRTAWNWSVAEKRFMLLYQVSATLMYLFEVRNWLEEGEDTFEKTASALRTALSGAERDALHEVALHALQAHHGFFLLRLGRGAEAYDALSSSAAFLRMAGEPLATIYSHFYLGTDCWILGRFSEAKERLQISLELAQQHGQRWYEACASELLGRLALEEGGYNLARQYLNEALVIMRQLGDPSMSAPMLRYLAITMQSLGEYRQAEKLLRESLELARAIDYRFAVGLALSGLGKVAYAQGRHEEASTYFSQCSSVFREMEGDQSLMRTLSYQGLNALALDQTQDAQNAFILALNMAYEGSFMPSVFDALAGLAALEMSQEPSQGTLALALYILQHPSSSQESKKLAARLLEELESGLTQEEIEAARQRVGSMDLDDLVHRYLTST